MKIFSFNVNGIRSRIHQLEELINIYSPDIIALQETKVSDEQFPVQTINDLGYQAYYFGQKMHYGVAILSKQKALSIKNGFVNDKIDAQKRLIIGEFLTSNKQKITIINGYFPQGESRHHETKFPHKESFYKQMVELLKTLHNEPTIVLGDMNIAPTDFDIGIGANNAKRWLQSGKCAFLPEERQWLNNIFDLGFVDSFRIQNQDITNRFSWFDYRSRGFDENRGLRIDLILTSHNLTNNIYKTGIDYEIRSLEKASDHAPVWLELKY